MEQQASQQHSSSNRRSSLMKLLKRHGQPKTVEKLQILAKLHRNRSPMTALMLEKDIEYVTKQNI